MSYNEYGDWVSEQEAMDETFTLLAVDLELDEDELRENESLVKKVKEYVQDNGTTWEDLAAICDEEFGTIEERLDSPTHEN